MKQHPLLKRKKILPNEIKRACSFFFKQISKGWTPVEAFNQVENAYGWEYKQCVNYYVAKNINKIKEDAVR